MIKLYTTGCPQCVVLKNKLDEKGIEYDTITNITFITDVAKTNGLRSVPILDVDGKILDYRKAIEWVKGE